MLKRDKEHETRAGIYVWDPFVRIFHWTLVLAVAVVYLGNANQSIHRWAGYAIGLLLLARVVWGLIGSPHARFSDFFYSPQTTLNYVANLLLFRRTQPRPGHSPGGGIVITLILVSLAASVGTGIFAYAAGGAGTGAAEWHKILADVTLALIFIHLVGITLRSLVYRENLIGAMVTGYKRRFLK